MKNIFLLLLFCSTVYSFTSTEQTTSLLLESTMLPLATNTLPYYGQ